MQASALLQQKLALQARKSTAAATAAGGFRSQGPEAAVVAEVRQQLASCRMLYLLAGHCQFARALKFLFKLWGLARAV